MGVIWPRSIIPAEVTPLVKAAPLISQGQGGKRQRRATTNDAQTWSEIYPPFKANSPEGRVLLETINRGWRQGLTFSMDHLGNYNLGLGRQDGTPMVNGAGQVGATLYTRGWQSLASTVPSNPLLRQGDIIRNASSLRIMQLTADAYLATNYASFGAPPGWTPSTGLTVTTGQTDIYGGTSAVLLNDTSSSFAAYVLSGATMPADNLTPYATYWVKAGSGAVTDLLVQQAGDLLRLRVTWSGGVPSVVAIAGTVVGVYPLANGFYNIIGRFTVANPALTHNIFIQPASGVVASTGTVIAMYMGVMDNGDDFAQFTTGAAVARTSYLAIDPPVRAGASPPDGDMIYGNVAGYILLNASIANAPQIPEANPAYFISGLQVDFITEAL